MSNAEKKLLCGIEGGGTSFKVVFSTVDDPTTAIASKSIPTTTPDETMQAILEHVRTKENDICAIGFGCFGPLDLNEHSETYGYVTTTPKEKWANANVLGAVRRAYPRTPIAFDTDVNAPALAEARYGLRDGTELESSAYITVGTGVGVGLVINGRAVHGLVHPEMGHISVPHCPSDSLKRGVCPYHESCVEGFVCSAALAKRFGVNASDLPTIADDDERWQVMAYYLAHLCAVLAMSTSVHRIVLGGGVMQRTSLFEKIRKQFKSIINGYLSCDKMFTEDYICPSRFGADAGAIGTLVLAYDVHRRAAASTAAANDNDDDTDDNGETKRKKARQ